MMARSFTPITCVVCGQQTERTNGRQVVCLGECQRVRRLQNAAAWRAANREQALANLRNWQRNNVERRRAYNRAYYQARKAVRS